MKRYIQSWKHNRRFGLPFRLVPSSWNCPLTPLAHFSWLWLVRKQYIWLEGLPSLEELFLLMTQQRRGLQLYFSNCLVKAFKWLTMNCRTQFRHLGMLDIDTFTKVSERLEFLLYSECICRLLLFSDGSCTFCNRNWLPTHLYGTYPLWSCGQRACQMLTHPSCLFTLWDICDGLLLGNSHEGRISILLRSEPSSPSWPSNYCSSTASCSRPAPTTSFSRFSRWQCWAELRRVADTIDATSSDKTCWSSLLFSHRK